MLNEFAYEFMHPVSAIFNASISSGIFPAIWKDSYISPISKTPHPNCEGDIRPISLTACLSKVLEDFVVKWLIFDVRDKIDAQEFGSLKGTNWYTLTLQDIIFAFSSCIFLRDSTVLVTMSSYKSWWILV